MKHKPKSQPRRMARRAIAAQPHKETKVDISNLTIGQAREIAALLNGTAKQVSASAYEVGQKYFIRTVTHYYTGRVTKVTDGELELAEAAWIADTGRFHEFLKHGAAKANEIEPYPDGCPVVIPRGGVIDASVWPHDLPRAAK